MSACTICASLTRERLESHPALRRRGVSHRFLEVFESYVCSDCGANWERTVLNEDTRAGNYRWTLTAEPNIPAAVSIPDYGCMELDHALASWIKPSFDEQVHA